MDWKCFDSTTKTIVRFVLDEPSNIVFLFYMRIEKKNCATCFELGFKICVSVKYNNNNSISQSRSCFHGVWRGSDVGSPAHREANSNVSVKYKILYIVYD